MTTPAPVNALPFTPTSFSDNSAATISISQETYGADEIRSSLSKAAETVAPSSPIPEPATVQIAAPAPLYAFSSPPIASSSPTTSSTFSQDQDIASYSTGTVTSTEERAAVESTALELSTSAQQIGDVSSTASAITPTAPTSDTKATSTTSTSSTTSTTDQTVGQDRDPDQRGTDSPSSTEPPTSYSALRSPVLYACVVLAVAGLVGAVFAFRANRKCDERRVVTEAPTAPPSPPHRAAWAPPVSQVRVVIDDHNIAML
ncbi:hypothetical protein PR003_g732 [Phytophthora rubi]|uniref:Uncharacterized protein n=1 Tax=Phytophthora rubi TaxID=129364 RepID=A0A6A4G5Q2_9STRA|nr:hypothetical protein PR002_g620 [Phytophthora rubi]KAE9051371.1 hypothetical protein PR001_g1522 [Phytophthora rubi]KAE9359431.1 hypothetical protein PR003_g732 [Phytophthora rubi]